MMLRILTCALTALIAVAKPVTAQTDCASAIAGFRVVINSDVKAGQVDRLVYDRMVPDVEHIMQLCRAGRDGEAMRALAGLKSRFGYH